MISSLKKRWPILFFLVFLLIFFRKTFFAGLLPIPSDLLVSWFFPYSSGGFIDYNSWTTHKGLVADDAVRQQYPWKTFSAKQWENGNAPLWNPYAFSGYPQLANLQTGAFYPLNFLFILIDPKIAWTILIMAQPLLSFIFMYLFLKTLRLSQISAAFGSLIFIGMTFEMLWLEQMIIGHTTLWLPLVLLCIQKASEGKKKWAVLGIVALTMSILAGYAQTSLYVVLIALSYFIYKLFYVNNKKEFITIGIVLFVFPLLLSAIQLLPVFEIYNFSAREGEASQALFGKFLATPRQLLTLFSSDIFGNVATKNFWGDQYTDFNLFFGIIALLVIVTGIRTMIISRFNLRECKLFIILGLVGLALAIPPLGFLPLILNIPILSTGVPARFIFIFQFCACIVAAFCFDWIIKEKLNRFSIKPATLIFIFIILLSLNFFFLARVTPNIANKTNYLVSLRNLVLTIGIAGSGLLGLYSLRFSKIRYAGMIFIIILAALEYLYLGNKYLPFAKKEYLFPDHVLLTFLKEQPGIDRFWGEGSAKIGTNIPTYYGLYYPEGYDSLYIKRYGELVNAAYDGQITKKIPRSDVNINEKSLYKERLLDILGVKFILDKNDIPKSEFEPEDWKFTPDRYKLIWQREKFKVYENLYSWPRIYFAQDIIVKDNDQEIINEIYKSKGKNIAVIEKPLEENFKPDNLGKINLLKYSPNKIIINSQSQEQGFLVISDNYFPGWEAYIDNQKTTIYRTNYTFRGISVPAGDHQIIFSYNPFSFRLGFVISLISLFGIIAIYFIVL
ncbi:MAG: YfhO family protein [Candidatus Gottesmanbacteria bacterium]